MGADLARPRGRLKSPLALRSRAIRGRRLLLAVAGATAAMTFCATCLHAQGAPKLVIDQDCQAFDISAQNDIVYAVPHLKRIKKLILERDDIWVASSSGKTNRIVDADKFMPIPPVEGYVVRSLAWSPDGKRIAVNMTLQVPSREFLLEMEAKKHKSKKNDDSDDEEDDRTEEAPHPAAGGNAVALLDDDGHEIHVAGLKTRFIENASDAAWLAGDQDVVYRSGDQLVRVRPSDGATTKLFEGHSFVAVVWDAPRSRAFAVGEDLTVHGGLALVELDLLHETVTPIAQLTSYRSALTVSPAGTRVGFFEDGDTIEVIDLANPSKPLRVNAGLGFFQWSHDEQRVLLKRGPENQSNDLVWVGLHGDTFSPALHDLEYHAFQIAPDGYSVAITEPGKRVLKVYPLP
jgi:hypothetical protein